MRNQIILKVLIAIILAILAGWFTGPKTEFYGVPYVKIYSFIGQLFLNGLKLVSVPLVSASIILGTARIGNEPFLGILGTKTFGFYILTSLIAVLIGMIGFLLLSPGISPEYLETLSGKLNSVSKITAESQASIFDQVSQIILKMVPSNILFAASQGEMLGLIFFSTLFGFFISTIDSNAASILLGFWNGIFQIAMKITNLMMNALPVGVFGLVAKVIATTGMESITSVGLYFITAILCFLVYALIALPLLLAVIGEVNPILYFKAMFPAVFTAFSTCSSAATLPITMECVEKNAGVSNRICSFTIPLGTSFNLSGSALYLCVSSLFIAHSYGIQLSITTLGLIAIMSSLTSMGIATIPSATLISVTVILNSLGVPSEGIGLIMAVERILDMFLTSANVLGNTTCAILIARSEGEHNVLASKSFLSI